MQAQLQGWDVTPGHGGLRGWSRSAAADVKDRQRGEAGQGFGTVCPVSAAIRLPTWLPRPGDRDLSDTRRSAAETAGSPELRQRPAVQLTGRLLHLPARLTRGQHKRWLILRADRPVAPDEVSAWHTCRAHQAPP